MNTDVLAALRRLTAECMDESGALLRPSLAAVQQAKAALARGIGVRSTTTEGRGPQGAEPGRDSDAPKTCENRSEDAPPSEPTA